MLASFESFLETAGGRARGRRARRRRWLEFDGQDQTDDELERAGVDVDELNGLARSYRKRFAAGASPPEDGCGRRSALGSVEQWREGVGLRPPGALRRRAQSPTLTALRRMAAQALGPRSPEEASACPRADVPGHVAEKTRQGPSCGRTASDGVAEDPGDNDTFFSYFFRGEGPEGNR